MNTIRIDEELENLLPKLEVEKYNLLRADIIKNGCVNPIIVWNGLIVDGHNRYRICKENNIEFKTKEMNFANKQEAMIWAWTTQKARRNVDDGTLFKIAEKFRPYYEQKAKEQQRLSQGRGIKKGFIEFENLNEKGKGFQKSEKAKEIPFLSNAKNGKTDEQSFHKLEKVEPINTTKELAEMAGTSQSTMNKVIQIQKHAPEPIKDAVESNVISINKGYELTKRVKDVPEEQKETEAERMIREGFKEIETNIAIQKNVHNAIYKILCVGFTDEELDVWYDGLDKCDLETLDDDLDRAIEKYEYVKEFIKQKRTIRRIK